MKLFGRKKKEVSEAQLAIPYSVLVGESQRPVADQEMMEQLGINIHMIDDEKITAILSALAVEKREDEKNSDVNLNALSLLVMKSKLIRASWVDPVDVEIAQLEVERLINRIEMEMDEETYEYGGTNMLEALSKIVQTAWSDAKGGRKAKLLKVTPRVFEISMNEPNKKKPGGIIS